MSFKVKAILVLLALAGAIVLWFSFKQTILMVFWGLIGFALFVALAYVAFKVWRWRRKRRA